MRTSELAASSGYRCFSRFHLRALLAYRGLAYAVGPMVARNTMTKIQPLSPGEAAALLSGLAHELEVERRRAQAARSALISIGREGDTVPTAGAGSGDDADGPDSMTITELSQALGVPTSTLRFWESEGLVAPDRVHARSQSARIYRATAIRDARITSALRTGGYMIPELREVIRALRELGDAGRSLTALDSRLETVARRTLALFRAGAELAELIDPGHR